MSKQKKKALKDQEQEKANTKGLYVEKEKKEGIVVKVFKKMLEFGHGERRKKTGRCTTPGRKAYNRGKEDARGYHLSCKV